METNDTDKDNLIAWLETNQHSADLIKAVQEFDIAEYYKRYGIKD